MHTFLQTIAREILAHSVPPEKQIVVLPTRRASYHLKRILAEGSAETMPYSGFLPEFYTLNEWLEQLSGLKQADKLVLKFECYAAYKAQLGSAAQSLDAFFGWSDALISDFNDIEAHGISPKSIFRELRAYSEIANFSFLDEPLSERQLRYREFWDALKEIYTMFNEKLGALGIGYPGLIARTAVRQWPENAKKLEDRYVTVAGFNALTPAEAEILQMLEQAKLGSVYFDADPVWLEDTENHAGLFIRQNLRKGLGTPLFSNAAMAERDTHLYEGSASNKMAQVEVVAAILASFSEKQLEQTALILADESMLLPILNRLPPQVNDANVTMGISLLQSSLSDWLHKVFDLQQRLLRDSGGVKVSTRELSVLYTHPFSSMLLAGRSALPTIDQRVAYVDLKTCHEALHHEDHLWMKAVLVDWQFHAAAGMQALLDFAAHASAKLHFDGGTALSTRMADSGLEVLMRFLRRLMHYPQMNELDLNALKMMVRDALASTSVHLLGEPARGLQIMGLLEARTLGFEQVILCDANEDLLPRKGYSESFIPFEIRAYHKLPGTRQKESVYAYHFYRLLHSCKSMYVVYHADHSGPRAAEPTRYLLQLKHHVQQRVPGLRLQKLELAPRQIARNEESLDIPKSAEVQALIEAYISSRLSASGMNRYLESSLEWYYEYVLQLQPPQNETGIAVATFGSLVHEALEELFKMCVTNEVLGLEMWDRLLAKADVVLRSVFTKSDDVSQFEFGINRLQFERARLMVRDYLRSERNAVANGAETIFVDTEKLLHRKLDATIGGRQLQAQFTGRTDLILRRDGVLHIIDFKTGMVRMDDLKVASMSVEQFAKKPKALQLLLYMWLCKNEYGADDMKAQIISLPQPSKLDLVPNVDLADPDSESAFEGVLHEILSAMYDASCPLQASADFKYAQFEPMVDLEGA